MLVRGREGSRDRRDIKLIVSSILVIRDLEAGRDRARFGRILVA